MNSLLRNLKPKDTNRQASSIPPSMQFWLCGISLQVAMVTLIIEMWLWVRSWSKCPWNLWKMFIWEQSKQNNTARTPTQNLCRQTEEQRDGKVRAPPPPTHTDRAVPWVWMKHEYPPPLDHDVSLITRTDSFYCTLSYVIMMLSVQSDVWNFTWIISYQYMYYILWYLSCIWYVFQNQQGAVKTFSCGISFGWWCAL